MDSEKKGKALIAAIVCLIIGCLLMILSPLWSMIFYGPLFLASFILSIVAISKGETTGGVMILLSIFIIPPIIFGIMFAIGINSMNEINEQSNKAGANLLFSPDSSETEEITEDENYYDNLEIMNFEARYFTDYLDKKEPGVRLKVKNNGGKTVKSIRIRVYFKDSSNNTISETELTPFNSTSMFDPDSPLRPNYIWQMGDNEYFPVEGVPNEWREGNVELEIINLDFEE